MVNDAKPKVVVAMSGGVDSSVTALLLHRAGYQVIGVTLRLYNLDQEELPSSYQGCCTLDDVEDARRVCGILGVPHYVLDMRRQFESYVIDYFVEEYRNGNTPHPCIACNDKIKFAFLAQRADFLGAQYVATGHYARIKEKEGRYFVSKGKDPRKDQSYVLWGLSQQSLSRSLFPLSDYTKEEIKQMAIDFGFTDIAKKSESYEICFIPDNDYRSFLKRRVDNLEDSVNGGNFMLINRIVSMMDALLLAKKWNNKHDIKLSMHTYPDLRNKSGVGGVKLSLQWK